MNRKKSIFLFLLDESAVFCNKRENNEEQRYRHLTEISFNELRSLNGIFLLSLSCTLNQMIVYLKMKE
jgi:hypothetical protein